ncbi:Oidioi.mRNA.OKI2018_I69.XSR.g16081.t1.cds [Oikopleura dioica]|uniref:Oidioi.mRNA.OKI2018_I69.XSR.g16081.t1.cds n=1 Tax=Oikopleura dioica TaxID=34765 RepID=A0ABN7SEX4_OIKDI|nr:Oidioi.mRNA.OKI2018_I69.XSR.g16081.t1.cds [Oikopleura dioica]
MSLVWTFSVIVPYLRGIQYEEKTCRLFGVQGVPESCWSHDFFQQLEFESSTKRSCAESECNQMLEDKSCVQFYVQDEKKNSSTFILHRDEVDISGLCQSQMHCSVRPKRVQVQSFSAKPKVPGSCLRPVDCESIVKGARDIFTGEEGLKLGMRTQCWINNSNQTAANYETLQVTGAMARKSLGTFFGGKVFHAVFWPLLGFMSSIFCCTTFWYKNRNHVLKFTQSG